MIHLNRSAGIITILSMFFVTTAYAQSNITSLQYRDTKNPFLQLTVVVIENRFIAKGIVTGIKQDSKGIQKFSLRVKTIERFKEYPCFGGNYVGKAVEIFSEIGIPSFFQVGIDVAVLLRVSGDERGQTLFLVEIF